MQNLENGIKGNHNRKNLEKLAVGTDKTKYSENGGTRSSCHRVLYRSRHDGK
jgi:hypothetical protein